LVDLFFVSLFAYLVGLVILLVLSAILQEELTLKKAFGFSHILKLSVWPLVCFVIAGFIAYRCDTPCFKSEKTLHIRILLVFSKAFLLGLFISLTVIFCYFISSPEAEIIGLPDLKPKDICNLVCYSIMGFFIGFALFFTSRSQTISDRRKYQRLKSNTPIFVVMDNKKFQAKLKNISREGAYIKCDQLSAAGAGETLKTEFQGNREITGRIVDFYNGKLRMSFQSEISFSEIRNILFPEAQKKLSFK
jgi:hypothetical protein